MGEETIVVKPVEIDPGCVIGLDDVKTAESRQKKRLMKQLPNGVASDFGCVHPVPTQLDETTGIRFDFNDGLRLMMPPEDIVWHVTVYNDETKDVLGKEMLPANSCLVYPIKYYIRYCIHIEGGGKVFEHTMELRGKPVAFKMCQRTLGDPIALFCNIPYFCQKHNCNAIVYAPERIADIFRNQYPEIDFRLLTEEDTTLPYATYYLGLFFSSDENNRLYQPQDWRLFGLQEQSRNILGLSERLEAEPPKVDLSAPRSIPEKYVCISYAGSKACKFWQNAYGWYEVTKYLKSIGYRILCIDRDPVYGPYPTC
ncbi:MAG: autotransporter strand-loop-strand O-heptosyltransferase, partial [Alphaproteobacteria bacterium]|nr:autotransporter strand-loop-strand O-heptosyltransferase [Alphaproteobacteria bacterium]